MKNAATQFFVIVMPWGRVGSNLVTAALAESADIEIDNEPTTRLKTLGSNEGWPRANIGARQLEQLSAFHQMHRADGGAAGLKLSHRSLITPGDYAKNLTRLGFRPIVMFRNNFLKCAVSQIRALARAEVHPSEQRNWQSPWAVGAAEMKPDPIPIDPRQAIRLTREFESHHHALMATSNAAFGPNVMRIEYHELASDPEATIRKIFRALDMTPPRKVRVPYKKATSDILEQDITNYVEFENAIRAAGLDHFLGE